MDRIFYWHANGKGFRLVLAHAFCVALNGATILAYAMAITMGVLLAFRVMG